MVLNFKNRAKLYDILHRGTIIGICVFSLGIFGLTGYNFYLFKTEGVPLLLNKYRDKLEKEIEYKQKHAELIEQRRAAERELLKQNSK